MHRFWWNFDKWKKQWAVIKMVLHVLRNCELSSEKNRVPLFCPAMYICIYQYTSLNLPPTRTTEIFRSLRKKSRSWKVMTWEWILVRIPCWHALLKTFEIYVRLSFALLLQNSCGTRFYFILHYQIFQQRNLLNN